MGMNNQKYFETLIVLLDSHIFLITGLLIPGIKHHKIVLGLQNALDFDEGGEIASNLNELYSYVVRRLFHVNAHNDIDALLEIHGLMEEIRQAWKSVPSLISPKKEANASGKSESITN